MTPKAGSGASIRTGPGRRWLFKAGSIRPSRPGTLQWHSQNSIRCTYSTSGSATRTGATSVASSPLPILRRRRLPLRPSGLPLPRPPICCSNTADSPVRIPGDNLEQWAAGGPIAGPIQCVNHRESFLKRDMRVALGLDAQIACPYSSSGWRWSVTTRSAAASRPGQPRPGRLVSELCPTECTGHESQSGTPARGHLQRFPFS